MRSKMRILFIVPILLSLQSLAFAWDDLGHQVVAYMAYKKLTPETQAKINRLLDPGETLMMASNWPDKVKKTTKWSFTAPFHFANSEENRDYLESKPASEGDAIRALLKFEKILKNKESSNEQKKIALRFVTHIIGDIHQPLHAGHDSDAGGNKIIVDFFDENIRTDLNLEGKPDGRPINLHVIWDYNIINEDIKRNCPNSKSGPAFKSYAECLNSSSVFYLTPDKSNSIKWLEESSSLLNVVYSFKENKIDEVYYQKAIKIIRKRLLLAANRLALRLEKNLNDMPETTLTEIQTILLKVFGEEAMLFRVF